MPPADEHHADVQHHDRDHHEVADAAQADHAALEVAELLQRTPPLERLRNCRILDHQSATPNIASGTLKIMPRMKPTVRLLVKNEATMPIASIARPTNQ